MKAIRLSLWCVVLVLLVLVSCYCVGVVADDDDEGNHVTIETLPKAPSFEPSYSAEAAAAAAGTTGSPKEEGEEAEVDLSNEAVLLWYAPVYSPSGYGSEAIEILHGLDDWMLRRNLLERRQSHVDDGGGMVQGQPPPPPVEVRHIFVVGHGDTADSTMIDGWPEARVERMSRLDLHFDAASLLEQSATPTGPKLVVVCHSEPGAWSLPMSNYPTAHCPPKTVAQIRAELQAELYSRYNDDDDEDWGFLPPDVLEPPPTVRPTLLIGRTMFETDTLPRGWMERLNQMDEVWVPSDFHLDIFSRHGVAKDKLFVVPEALDAEGEWNPDHYRPDFFEEDAPVWGHIRVFGPAHLRRLPRGGVSIEENEKKKTRKGTLKTAGEMFNEECDFRFLSVFKWEERKGWDILLSAFFEEFQGWATASAGTSGGLNEKVCLVLKTSGYHSDIDDGDEEVYADVVSIFYRRKYGADWKEQNQPKILIVSAHVDQSFYPSLFLSCHALVQPSRGEGWGRPHMEAMSLGLPVIATNWSGNTAFMEHEKNSFLIEVDRMSEITSGAFAGHNWAEPSIADLRRLMRKVVEQTRSGAPELQQVRRAARQTVLDRFTPDIVAEGVLKRVEYLLSLRAISSSDTSGASEATGSREEDL